MVTHLKGRCIALVIALAVGAASPCLAKLAEEDLTSGDGSDLSFPSGIVRSFADDFTDAIQLVILELRSVETMLVGLVPAGYIHVGYHIDGLFDDSFHWRRSISTVTRVEDHEGRLFTVSFVDEYLASVYGGTDRLEVVFRVDSLEAVTLTGGRAHSGSRVRFLVSETWVEELLDMVRDAETIIYRIGVQGKISQGKPSHGQIFHFSVPAEMPELVAEFRRRVAAVAGAE